MRLPLVLSALLVAGPALAQPAIPPGPGPADPAVARVLSRGLEGLCAGFLKAPRASPEAITALAAKAGFEAGAADAYGPVGAPIPGAPPALAFHANLGAAADAPSVVIHLTTVPTACQVRVKGDAAAWSAFLNTMPARGGHLVTSAELEPDTTYSHEVYTGGMAGLPKTYTTFVNRWVGQGAPKSGVWTVINVLPDTGVQG